MDRFKLDDVQAQAILDMRLKALQGLDIILFLQVMGNYAPAATALGAVGASMPRT